MLRDYEVSGIDSECENGDDDVICNPILFKGDRFVPVEDEELFTGVYRKKAGQVSWAQLKIHSNLEDREKRDLPFDTMVKGIESFFDMLRGMKVKKEEEEKEEEKCNNQPGAVFLLNGNLNEDDDLYKHFKEVLDDLYTNMMCRRAKRTILAGNVGWTQSQEVIMNFRRGKFFRKNGMLLSDPKITGKNGILPFPKTTGILNVNQIWSNDFKGIMGTNSDMMEYEGKDLKQPIKGRNQAVIAPSFVGFHHSLVKKQDKASEE